MGLTTRKEPMKKTDTGLALIILERLLNSSAETTAGRQIVRCTLNADEHWILAFVCKYGKIQRGAFSNRLVARLEELKLLDYDGGGFYSLTKAGEDHDCYCKASDDIFFKHGSQSIRRSK